VEPEDNKGDAMPKSRKVGLKWVYGILAVILILGVFFAAMIAVRPYGTSGWVWAAALTVYVPFVFVGAGTLKYLVLLAQRLFRP
jgi:uncharacterized membrane protein